MRRSLSALVLGLSLVTASVAWAGFVLTRTALDPDRSEVLADQVLDNEQLRGVLANRVADGLQRVAPENVALPRQVFVAAATVALQDPAVESIVRDGLVRVHQNALLGVDEDVILNATAVGTVARNRLVEANPELNTVLPQAPAVRVELPTGGLSVLGTIRVRVEQVTFAAALLAVTGAVLALGLAKNRPGVLRRVGFWAFGTALFWLALGLGVPYVAAQLAPSSGAVIAAVVEVFFGNMIQPGVVMAVAGVGLLLLSALWFAFAKRRGALLLQPMEPAQPVEPAPAHQTQPPRPAQATAMSTPTMTAAASPTAHSRVPPSHVPPPTLPAKLPQRPTAAEDRTQLFPTAQMPARQQTVVRPSPATHTPAGQPPEARPIHATQPDADPAPSPTMAPQNTQAQPGRHPLRSHPTPESTPTLQTAPVSHAHEALPPQHVRQAPPATDITQPASAVPKPGSGPPRWVPGKGYVDAEPDEDAFRAS